ncbi:MAG: trimethylamine methyltransferase family protein, partial [Gammaproteobacteria bacterium]|nr:trimethylamine methyltransferase family protein [Gammaproteobacteria bacterium]
MARRSGGRQAKLALRKAALADDMKPVHAGETGGQYQPLSDSDVKAVDDTVFKILDEVGFAQATQHCIEACTAIGAIYGPDERLRFPRAVVEDAMNKCCRNLTLHGQDPKHDLHLTGQKVHFSTAGAAVMIADPIKNEYRESTAQDLYDMARIADQCDNIHMFQRMCV